jgi:hypothetical protein
MSAPPHTRKDAPPSAGAGGGGGPRRRLCGDDDPRHGVSHSAPAAALPDGGAAGCMASGQDAHCLVALPGVTMGTAVSDRRTSDSQTALRERSV